MSDFKTARLAEGFDEVTERNWAPNQVVPIHTHPFAVHALVTAGEMWFTDGPPCASPYEPHRVPMAVAQT